MQRFLEYSAGYLLNRFGKNLTDLTLVFPNRRSGVFFTAYLQHFLKQPLIGPHITTINELMLSLSDLIVPDKLLLIAELYESFRQETGSKESFDDFYYWGEVMLADFDDADKYLTSGEDLFRNISEVKEIENHFQYLSDTQKEMLRQFWGSLPSDVTNNNFSPVWKKLYPIYVDFKKRLLQNGIGYTGIVIRDGVEHLTQKMEKLGNGHFCFIGLNALNNCEIHLMERLRNENRADFFWDYNSYYLDNPLNDAGTFLRENRLRFPEPHDFKLQSDTIADDKKISIISVAGSVAQAQTITGFLDTMQREEKSRFDETAIVLADESLLIPVLEAIPPSEGKINITMGYPVKSSPVMSLIQLLGQLLRNTPLKEGEEPLIYKRLVTEVLTHQLPGGLEPKETTTLLKSLTINNSVYIKSSLLKVSPFSTLLFDLPHSVMQYPAYFKRILQLIHNSSGEDIAIRNSVTAAIFKAIDRLETLLFETMADRDFGITTATFFRLLHQYTGSLSVPFEGEPLSGIQVMGILETRCLDFRNIIIIGLNEDIWPRTSTAPSMIPYSIRKAFGLPGIDDQDAMYAYYFYRLIQRPSTISVTWNTIREGMSGGELSRYGHQLIRLGPFKVTTGNFELPFGGEPPGLIKVEGSSEISERLLERNSINKPLSPSAINTWLNCTFKFYLSYVVGLKETEELTEEIDQRMFGNLFHKAVELLYTPYKGQSIPQSEFERLINSKVHLDQLLRKAFATEYFKLPTSEAGTISLTGKALLVFFTLKKYLINLLKEDMLSAPLTIYALESSTATSLDIEINGTMRKIYIGGKIDRIDETGGCMRVVDYKTGNLEKSELNTKQLTLLSLPEKNLRKEIIQSLTYGYSLFNEGYTSLPIQAAVFAIQKLATPDFSATVRLNGTPVVISDIAAEWESEIKSVLTEIYSSNTSFEQTTIADRCSYCQFKTLCRK